MTPFALVDAASAADAVALLRRYGRLAQPVATGGDLLGLLKEGVDGPGLPAPKVLVNLATAADLRGMHMESGWLRIGAMTTLADLASRSGVPHMLLNAIPRIASPQLRARTTIAGNLLQRPRCWYFRHPDIACFKKGSATCAAVGGPDEAYPGALLPGTCHAGHASDLAPALIALGAEVEILGAGGTRVVALENLYDGAANNPMHEARLGRAELMTAINVPASASVQSFEKAAARSANEFAWASVAIAIEVDAGRIAGARLALGGIAQAPILCRDAHRLMLGRQPSAVKADVIADNVLTGLPLAHRFPARAAACRAAIVRALARLQSDA